MSGLIIPEGGQILMASKISTRSAVGRGVQDAVGAERCPLVAVPVELACRVTSTFFRLRPDPLPSVRNVPCPVLIFPPLSSQ